MTTAVDRSVGSYRDAALLIGRLLIAALFLLSFWGKISDIQGTVGYYASLGIPTPTVVVWLSIIFEAVVGPMLLFGYQTRLAALAAGAFVLVAGLIAHTNFGDMNEFSHFLKNIAIIGGCLALYAAGAGSYSFDERSRN